MPHFKYCQYVILLDQYQSVRIKQLQFVPLYKWTLQSGDLFVLAVYSVIYTVYLFIFLKDLGQILGFMLYNISDILI